MIGVIVMREFWAVIDAVLAMRVGVTKLILKSAPVSSNTQSQNGER